ncbi:hypothetical protein [Virgibacillus senegalensis]|uniref:hypothetical protein n=1 Tax=Virgibacillus senegalensis TaxID=1499679 RepID=UPI00069E94C2|nr:hypothetical protein [Virgibacillus senegalensis]
MKKTTGTFLMTCVLMFIIPILILSAQTDKGEIAEAGNTEHVAQKQVEKSSGSDHEAKKRTPSHEELVSVTETFIDLLVQETEENYRVTAYSSIDELTEAFSRVATPDAVKKYIDYYYTEKEDGLYLLPAETPPWFQSEAEYEMIETGDGTVKVIQDNQTDLQGSYTLELELTFDDNWKITETKHS